MPCTATHGILAAVVFSLRTGKMDLMATLSLITTWCSMAIDMRRDMCMGMSIGMGQGICIGVCKGMCVGMFMGMCIDTHLDVCIE